MRRWGRIPAVLVLPVFAGLLAAADSAHDQRLVCRGNEPFWRLDANGDTAKLTRPAEQGIAERVFQGGMSRVDFLNPPWILWRGVETKEPVSVLVASIREESCQDSMSGEPFDYRGILSLPGEAPLVGCCHVVTQEKQTAPTGPALDGDSLYGPSWLLSRMEGRDLAEPGRPFITFASGGKVTGNAGCNQFGGKAEVAGNTLRLGPLIATRRACADQERMGREERFLDALQRARSWRIEQGHLLLLNEDDGELLRFERQE